MSLDFGSLIPWPEVVKSKQEQDVTLLQTIEHYRALSEAEGVANPERAEALKLMKQYQRIYLGLQGESDGL